MNNVVLVGRLTEDPDVVSIDDGKQVTTINIAVTRNYKNPDGVYETDFIRCVLWNGIAANTSEYCHSGDVIGIKGRLQTRHYEDTDKKRIYITEVIAERVTFLSSQKKVEDVNKKKKEK